MPTIHLNDIDMHTLPEAMRAICLRNAPAFAAEQRDPDWSSLDTYTLERFPGRVLLTKGDTARARHALPSHVGSQRTRLESGGRGGARFRIRRRMRLGLGGRLPWHATPALGMAGGPQSHGRSDRR